MDEYEIELIDFLGAVWRGKWIILGCLIVLVGLSVLYTGLQPTTYSGSAKFVVREYVTAAFDADREGTAAAERAMELAVGETSANVPYVVAKRQDNQVTFSLSGASSTNAANSALTQASETLNQQLELFLERELGYLATETELQETSLSEQIRILRQRVSEEQTAVDAPIMGLLTGIEVALVQVQVRLATLASVQPADLFDIRSIGQSTFTAVEPNRKATIMVAGVLGLFLGVVLALFVQYLLRVRAKGHRSSKKIAD